jgi:CxxC motif-containing protein (DUF1111 family)
MKLTRLIFWGATALVSIVGLSADGAQPVLSIQSGVTVNWFATTGATYRAQWSPHSSGAGPWTDLGAPVIGDATTHSLYDPLPKGVRHYRVLEMLAGSTPVPPLPVNGGFETGPGVSAANWSTSGSQPPIRVGNDAHSGSFSMHCTLTNATVAPSEAGLSQNVAAQGGTVVAGQTYMFSFWARQVTAGPSYVQQYQVQWLDGVGGILGGSGLVNFNGGMGAWTRISAPSLIAPTSTVGARIQFRFVTGAVAGGHGELFLDDVALESSGISGGPGQTNVLQIASEPVARVSWPSASGIQYQPESTTSLAPESWTNILPAILGDGSAKSFLVAMAGTQQFIRLQSPQLVVLPPANLRVIPSGITGAIGLAWDSSPTLSVLGYRIFYGVLNETFTDSIVLGSVTTATVSGLTPGQTYYFTVIAYTADQESERANVIAAEPQENTGLVALFDAGTPLEPPTTIDTATALITHVADRARDRHAREGMFNAYDHYLSWYWEERTIAIEIMDRVAKGGTGITFNYTTLTPLSAPEFRAFFRGLNTVAEYHFNVLAPLVGSNSYSATVISKLPENRPLQVGDRVEIEISQFLQAPLHGRNNYYGTAILYVVGQGIVPWQGVGALLDSFPLPENAWLGGQTTLPYQYSNEPEHRFKQTAGNIAPINAQPFMLGRRLHHTDFGSGAHSESGNPLFTGQIGKLGPKFIARSCIECHINNGRALPAEIGAAMTRAVVKVGSDANGSPHPILGAVLQPQSISGPGEGSATIASYTSIESQYGDGTPYSLRKPIYTFDGVTPPFFSVRLAPPLVGLGLLEAVSESIIIALADPDDANADGVSGRFQTVLDPETGEPRLGRFTSKAGKARLSHQIAAALNTDMGVTTAIFPALDHESLDGAPELSGADLDKMTRYVALLGVGARRDLTNLQALQGEQLFSTAQCVKCHTPTLTTSPYHPMTELRSQTIHPYTDLLLHDLGAGLADTMGELGATGSEWRTPPLWSIGLTAGVSGGEAYLHDGRARTLEEAILWHGGEAEGAKESFRTMSAADRAALIKFLESL